jgi:hypothetical protein
MSRHQRFHPPVEPEVIEPEEVVEEEDLELEDLLDEEPIISKK